VWLPWAFYTARSILANLLSSGNLHVSLVL
jgi:hypothetical protein